MSLGYLFRFYVRKEKSPLFHCYHHLYIFVPTLSTVRIVANPKSEAVNRVNPNRRVPKCVKVCTINQRIYALAILKIFLLYGRIFPSQK